MVEVRLDLEAEEPPDLPLRLELGGQLGRRYLHPHRLLLHRACFYLKISLGLKLISKMIPLLM